MFWGEETSTRWLAITTAKEILHEHNLFFKCQKGFTNNVRVKEGNRVHKKWTRKKARKCLVPNFHVARNWIWAWHWDTAAVWPCLESDSLIALKPSHYAWFLEAVTLSLIPSKPSHYAWFPWTSWSCHTKFDSLEAFTLCLIPSKPSHYAWFPWSLHTMRDSCHTCMSTSCLLVLSLRASHDY